jgi:hypothetical protein
MHSKTSRPRLLLLLMLGSNAGVSVLIKHADVFVRLFVTSGCCAVASSSIELCPNARGICSLPPPPPLLLLLLLLRPTFHTTLTPAAGGAATWPLSASLKAARQPSTQQHPCSLTWCDAET